MPHSRRWILRVETDNASEAAVLFRSQRWRVVRICRVVGGLEGFRWQLAQDLFDSHHDAECSDLRSSQQDASHPQFEGLRDVARSRNAESFCVVRTVQTL